MKEHEQSQRALGVNVSGWTRSSSQLHNAASAMIRLANLSKSFGSRELFTDVSLSMEAGTRLALFGRNGSGKSTILRMIAGEMEPDGGTISVPRGYQIGFLRQHLQFSNSTVLAEACADIDSSLEYKAKTILTGLGFSDEAFEADPQSLSGGFQIRINLAKLILAEPNLLLLDEPTNYLDIVSIRWLERYLTRWEGELILISHDRTFCDAVSTHSALIRRGTLKLARGDSEKLYAQIEQEEELYEKTRQNIEKQRKHMESFIDRFRAKASKASVVQSRVKALDRLESLDELAEESTLAFRFPTAPFPGKYPLEIEGLGFSYGSESGQLIDNLSLILKKDDRIGIIGKNGRGKSTLLRLLADELTPSTGIIRRSPNARIGYFGQTNIDRLDPKLTIFQEIEKANIQRSPREIRGICGLMMFSASEADKKIEVLSGGERSRVLLGKLLATDTNILLLDEPTNHLDMASVLALTSALEEFEGAVCIVTHNEELLREATERLVVFQGPLPFLFEGSYDDFLERVGWADEQSERVAAEAASGASSRNKKRERAEIVQEKSRVLNPLKKKVATIEAEIAKLEASIGETEQALITASESNDGKKIAELAKLLEDTKQRLSQRYAEWEDVSSEFEAKSKEFEKLLAQD